MKKWALYLLSFLCLGGGLLSLLSASSKWDHRQAYTPIDSPVLIDHAGGGLPQDIYTKGTYSNSEQAIKRALENGFDHIEIDFSWTQSGELVLLHDWGRTKSYYFPGTIALPRGLAGFMPKADKSADLFMQRPMAEGLTQMDLPALLVLMKQNSNVKIITDVKDTNIEALSLLAKAAPS